MGYKRREGHAFGKEELRFRQKGIRWREFERFITTLEKLPEEVTTFEESMWSNLVEYVTVSGKDDLQFTLACGVEMQA